MPVTPLQSNTSELSLRLIQKILFPQESMKGVVQLILLATGDYQVPLTHHSHPQDS